MSPPISGITLDSAPQLLAELGLDPELFAEPGDDGIHPLLRHAFLPEFEMQHLGSGSPNSPASVPISGGGPGSNEK